MKRVMLLVTVAATGLLLTACNQNNKGGSYGQSGTATGAATNSNATTPATNHQASGSMPGGTNSAAGAGASGMKTNNLVKK